MKRAEPLPKPSDSQAGQPFQRKRSIQAEGVRIWGNEADATDWLNAPHLELRGATPLSMLKTEEGARAVEALLAAIEFGFPV
jgi:putative toxin-antitoxin system antitoxin component (TIGR02293 family)